MTDLMPIKKQVFSSIQKVKESYELGQIHPAEAVTLTVLIHIISTHSKTWMQGLRKNIYPAQITQNSELEKLWSHIIGEFIPNKNEISHIPFWNYFINTRVKNISERIFTSLYSWRFENWPLILYQRVLSPLEVLFLQAEGKRCVSVLWDKNNFDTMITKDKNSLEFTLHDLDHAERFFFDKEIMSGQIEFYKNLVQEIDQGRWAIPLTDPQFKVDFEYLMSDMNTHPEHQRQYLKAILINHQKRQVNQSANQG